MNARREPRIRGFGWIAFSALALLAVLALGAFAGEAQAKSGVGFLGISTQRLSGDLRDSYNYRGPGGVLVTDVEPNSAAARAGIQRDDILLRYRGETVSSPEELARLVRADEPDTRVPVTVWRDGTERALQVTLGSRSGSAGVPYGNDDRVRIYRHDDDDDNTQTYEWHEMPGFGDMGHTFDMFTVRPRLGVEIQNLNGDLGSYFSAPDGNGVLITRVIEDTPAARAGLKAGDVIIDVGGQKIDDTEDLQQELRKVDEGPVRLTVLRHGSRQQLTAQVEERAERGMAMRAPRAPGAPRNLGDPRREADLRREIDDLNRQLDELRRQMEDLRDDR